MLPGVFALLSDDTPVFGPVVIGGHAVVGIHPVGRRLAVGREYSGDLPASENEIVVQESFLDSLGASFTIAFKSDAIP